MLINENILVENTLNPNIQHWFKRFPESRQELAIMWAPCCCPSNASHAENCIRLIPKADRKKIHEYLFRGTFTWAGYFLKNLVWADWELKEGVLVAKKDFNLPKHNEIDTKNLYVRPTYSFLPRCTYGT